MPTEGSNSISPAPKKVKMKVTQRNSTLLNPTTNPNNKNKIQTQYLTYLYDVTVETNPENIC